MSAKYRGVKPVGGIWPEMAESLIGNESASWRG